MHKIFITGGCGFIGSHLTEFFFKKYKNSKIYVYDKITYAASVKNLNEISKSKRLRIIKKDLSNLNALKKYSKDTNIFIHAAAESHVDNSFNLTNEFIKTNVIGTKNVLDACKANNINPQKYLTKVLSVINGYKVKDIAELLPWNIRLD